MIACAKCRQNLRGERGRHKAHMSSGRGVWYDDDNCDDGVGWVRVKIPMTTIMTDIIREDCGDLPC